MRVLFNLTTSFEQKTGIGHYVAELYRGLQTQAGPDRILPFPSPWITRLTRFLNCHCTASHACAIEKRRRRLQAERPTGSYSPLSWLGGVRRLRIPDRSRVVLCQTARKLLTWRFRKCLSRSYCDLYHEPNYIPLESDIPTVLTVCDLSVLLHPEWHPADRVAWYEQHFHKGLKQCVHFLTISEFSRREIIRHLGIAPERVTCTYLGPRAGMRPLTATKCEPVLSRFGLRAGSYLLYVGTLEPRKNLETLLRAYLDLPSELRSRCPLVLAGGWGWRADELRRLYEDEARHRGVRHLGYVEDADLPALYSGARALTFPSLYEGFGLPPVEMMACGGAVLASTAEAVAETAGPVACLLEPLDVSAWCNALARAISDNDWLAQLRRGTEAHAARFSWEGCARDTLNAYRRIAGGAKPVELQAAA